MISIKFDSCFCPFFQLFDCDPLVYCVGLGNVARAKYDQVLHVGEHAAIVAIEAAATWDLRVAGPGAAVRQVEIRIAIVIQIEEGRPRAHGLGQVLLPGGAAVVDEGDPVPGSAMDDDAEPPNRQLVAGFACVRSRISQLRRSLGGA